MLIQLPTYVTSISLPACCSDAYQNVTLTVGSGWRQSVIAKYMLPYNGNDVWIARITFTVPAGQTVVLRVTDWLLSSDQPSIWSADGSQVMMTFYERTMCVLLV